MAFNFFLRISQAYPYTSLTANFDNYEPATLPFVFLIWNLHWASPQAVVVKKKTPPNWLSRDATQFYCGWIERHHRISNQILIWRHFNVNYHGQWNYSSWIVTCIIHLLTSKSSKHFTIGTLQSLNSSDIKACVNVMPLISWKSLYENNNGYMFVYYEVIKEMVW